MKVLTIFLILLSSCTQNMSLRSPSSEQGHDSYLKDLEKLHKFVLTDNSKDFCKKDILTLAYDKMYGLTQDEIQLDSIEPEEKEKAISLSFNIRLDSRKHLQFINDNPDLNNCYSNYRDLSRALRYLEDYLIEDVESKKLYDKNYENLKGQGTFFLVNPKYKETFKHFNDLESGDVILSRGNAYTSAAISRIAEDDAQFSHMSFVYKDDLGNLFTTEAHIEVGNVTAGIRVHIDQKNARTVVFRYLDPKAAHLASKCMFDKVKARQDQGNIIQYDFGMEHDKDDKLFCSEVAYTGFQCLEDKVDVPYTKSRFSVALMPFLQSIGVKVNENNIQDFKVVSPGDYEFDPRFELIAEWRNPQKLKKIRYKDAILSKMFEWMENEQFILYSTTINKVRSWAAWIIRRQKWADSSNIKRIKNLKSEVTKQVPLNMTRTQMGTFATLEEVGEIMEDYLNKRSIDEKRNLSYSEAMELLDESRKIEESKILGKTWYKYFKPKK